MSDEKTHTEKIEMYTKQLTQDNAVLAAFSWRKRITTLYIYIPCAE